MRIKKVWNGGTLVLLAVAFLLLMPASPALAAGDTWRDEFNYQLYSNQDGSALWANNWDETNDGTDSPTGGDIQVVTDTGFPPYVLRLTGESSPNEEIVRYADLTGFTSATLSYRYRRSALNDSGDQLFVEVRDTSPTSYLVLNTIQGPNAADASYTSVSHTIPADRISSTTRIRFRSGDLESGEYVYIDDVQITALAPTANSVDGIVFRDYDADGHRDLLEPGIQGIVVTAYDTAGNVIGSPTTTAADGSYSLGGFSAGAQVRLEFTLPTDGSLDFLEQGAAGRTRVVFVTVPAAGLAGIDVGWNNPSDYAQADPPLVVAKSAMGNPPGDRNSLPAFVPGSGSDQLDESIVGIGWNASGDLSASNAHTTYATLKQTGSLYGMIYQRTSELILAGTYFKSFTDTGPVQGGGWLAGVDPLGAIYASRADGSISLPNAAVYANLNKIIDPSTATVIPGNPAGIDPRRTGAYNYDTATCGTGATTEAECWVHDPAAWANVGAIGLGDLEQDDEERFVFVVNLKDKKLYQLPIDPNPANWPITTLAAPPVAIPNTCSAFADAVPGGLGFKDGNLYVGVTCTAKSTWAGAYPNQGTPDRNQLKAEVWEFDPDAQTFSASPVFSMPLTQPRGCVWTPGGTNTSTNWPKNWPWPPTNPNDYNCQEWANGATGFDGSTATYNNMRWNPWPPDWQTHFTSNAGANGPGLPGWVWPSSTPTQPLVQIEYPHPWLSDLAFDNDDLILGFRDINGDRTGNDVRPPNTNPGTPTRSSNPDAYELDDIVTDEYILDGAGFGDLMRACANGSGGWDLENNGTCGGVTTPGANNGQGPGTLQDAINNSTGAAGSDGFLDGVGEWYWDDSGPGSRNAHPSASQNPAPLYYGHEEVIMGGIFQRSGDPSVAVTIADQFGTGDGGVQRFSSVVDHPQITLEANGNLLPLKTWPLALSDSNPATGNEAGLALNHTQLYGNDAGFFGKSNGLGDVEALLEPAPLEIGNRVWNDSLHFNGRQDPDELPIAGVVVQLWKDTTGDGTADTLVAQTTTDANGNYLFSYSGNPNSPTAENWSYTADNEVLPNTTYEIRIGTAQAALTGINNATGANLHPDLRDSDGIFQNTGNPATDYVAVNFTTGGPGANNHDYDFGFLDNDVLVNLGNQVWYDKNNNGLIDTGEPGIDGVRVELYADTNGDGVYTPGVDSFQGFQTTAGGGFYNFTGLTPGNYVVVIPQSQLNSGGPLAGYASSTGNNPTPDPDNDQDNDDNGYQIPGVGVASQAVTLSPGTEPDTAVDGDGTNGNLTVDFGFFGLGAIGNYVWVDENSDGYQDAGEPGIPNVQVVLKDAQGVVIATTFTDSHGGYLFDDLPPGNYFVDVYDGTGGTPNTLPFPGMTQTPSTLPVSPPGPGANQDFGNQDHTTNPNGYPVTIGGGQPLENLTADFGYNYNPYDSVNPEVPGIIPVKDAALGDRVWIDSNGDGVQDPEEIGVQGVEVTLYYDHDADGVYDMPYTVGGYTPTRTTNANGYYMFDGLPPGAYVVRVTNSGSASHDVLNTGQYDQTGDPDHFGTSSSNVMFGGAAGDNATTIPVVLGPGDVFLNADFGYRPDGADLGSIGDTVWFDADADGTGPSIPPVDGGGAVTQGNPANPADGSEYGIPGVTVSLIRDLNSNGQWDAGEPIIATDTTDANGQYLFPGLPITNGTGTDDYLVWVSDTDNVLGEMVPTWDKDTTAPTAGLVTGLGISRVQDLGTSPVRDQDFGYTNTYQQSNPANPTQPLGLIGDYVWFDTNRDNFQDGNEAGVEGVVVELLNSTGTQVIATTVTDENGYYSFGGLPLNTSYIVRVPASNFGSGAPLEGTASTGGPVGGTGNIGPVVNLTPANPVNLVQDFGYAAPINQDGSIGNKVWEDLNADGIWQANEPGIDGVTLDLYRDLNDNGAVDPGEPRVGTTTTAGGGLYLFDALPIVGTGGQNPDPEADYVVDVTDVDGVLNGYWHSISGNQDANTTGGNDTNDNSKIDPFAVEIGTGVGGQPVPDNRNVDFGYYVKPAAVGNWVWHDVDGDGIQNDGNTGIPNVEIELTIQYPDGTITTIVTKTDANGFYSFGQLLLDEDYRQGATPPPTPPTTEPIHTIRVLTTPGTGALSSYPYPSLIGVTGSTTFNDSNNPNGTTALPVQGQTDVSAAQNGTVPASYDFGYSGTPTSVEGVVVGSFGAAWQGDLILVFWTTVSELDVQGFDLYRATSPDGEKTKLNTDLIPSAAPGSPTGTDYQFEDKTVQQGTVYYYWLHGVDLRSQTTPYGPVIVSPNAAYLPLLFRNQ